MTNIAEFYSQTRKHKLYVKQGAETQWADTIATSGCEYNVCAGQKTILMQMILYYVMMVEINLKLTHTSESSDNSIENRYIADSWYLELACAKTLPLPTGYVGQSNKLLHLGMRLKSSRKAAMHTTRF